MPTPPTLPRRPRFARLLLALLGAFGTAQAGVLHLPVPVSGAALLGPDPQALHAACDAGFRLALFGKAAATGLDGVPTEHLLSGAGMPAVTLITALGSMLNTCHRASMDSRVSEDARHATTGTVWVTVRGTTQTGLRAEAQGWFVSLSVQDSAGRELARLEPTLVAAGRPELWSPSCPKSECVWTGENRYGFDLGQLTATTRAAVQAAARVVVDVDLPVPELMAGRP